MHFIACIVKLYATQTTTQHHLLLTPAAFLEMHRAAVTCESCSDSIGEEAASPRLFGLFVVSPRPRRSRLRHQQSFLEPFAEQLPAYR